MNVCRSKLNMDYLNHNKLKKKKKFSQRYKKYMYLEMVSGIFLHDF